MQPCCTRASSIPHPETAPAGQYFPADNLFENKVAEKFPTYTLSLSVPAWPDVHAWNGIVDE
jgi:hypothetical protein